MVGDKEHILEPKKKKFVGTGKTYVDELEIMGENPRERLRQTLKSNDADNQSTTDSEDEQHECSNRRFMSTK